MKIKVLNFQLSNGSLPNCLYSEVKMAPDFAAYIQVIMLLIVMKMRIRIGRRSMIEEEEEEEDSADDVEEDDSDFHYPALP